MSNPLDFLGLYKTHSEASGRQHIPAKSISGDSCEAQILVAGQRYRDRPTVLENILNDLFHVFRYETCQNLKEALDILLLAMERFVFTELVDRSHLEDIQAQPGEAHPDIRQCLTLLCCQVRELEEGLECESEEEDPEYTAEWHADSQGGPHHDEEWLPNSVPVPDPRRCSLRL